MDLGLETLLLQVTSLAHVIRGNTRCIIDTCLYPSDTNVDVHFE